MDFLSILIKERDLEWPKTVAKCVESFSAIGALKSSGFQLTLADLLVVELDARCRLFVEHGKEESVFDEYFDAHKAGLSSMFKSRFGVEISGGEKCVLLREKYKCILQSAQPPRPKPPIGFN